MTALTIAEERRFIGLLRDFISRGCTFADAENLINATKAPNPLAAYQELLTEETRPAMRCAIQAGIAAIRERLVQQATEPIGGL